MFDIVCNVFAYCLCALMIGGTLVTLYEMARHIMRRGRWWL